MITCLVLLLSRMRQPIHNARGWVEGLAQDLQSMIPSTTSHQPRSRYCVWDNGISRSPEGVRRSGHYVSIWWSHAMVSQIPNQGNRVVRDMEFNILIEPDWPWVREALLDFIQNQIKNLLATSLLSQLRWKLSGQELNPLKRCDIVCFVTESQGGTTPAKWALVLGKNWTSDGRATVPGSLMKK